MALERSEQKIEVIYVCPDGSAFWSPDGEGRFYFESLQEAQENADTKVGFTLWNTTPPFGEMSGANGPVFKLKA